MPPLRFIAAAILLAALAAPARAQGETRPVKETFVPQVGAFYFYWYRHPAEHFTNADGSDGLFQHFTAPKEVDYAAPAWHRAQLESMMDAGIDVVLPVYWGIPDRSPREHKAGKFSDTGLEALVKAAQEIEIGGGVPPKIAMFYDTSTLLRSVRGEEGAGTLDLRTESGRHVFRDTIAGFFSRVPQGLRFELEGADAKQKSYVCVLYSSFGAAHERDLLEKVSDELAVKLGRRLSFVVDESWDARATARYRWGAALHGPNGDALVKVIGPGYNDTKVPGRATPIRSREEGRFYLWSWNQVLLEPSRLTLIETWNEFHEGSGIARCVEFEDTYLDITRRSIQRLKNHLLPDTAKPVRLSYPEPIARPDEGWWARSGDASSVSWSAGSMRDDRGDGLRVGRCEDGPFKVEFLGDRTVCTTAARGTSAAYLYFGIADELTRATAQSFEVEIELIDGGAGTIGLHYDAWDQRATLSGAYKATPVLRREGAARAGKIVFTLPDARFSNRQNGGCDFRIAVTGEPLSIMSVTVRKTEKKTGAPAAERR
jgi:hypothetical protein